MSTDPSRPSWSIANPDSPFHTVILVCLVGTLCYLAARIGGTLTLLPKMISPLWPGCALLVSVLLLVPRKIWPILIPAGFAAFVLYDLQAGVPIGLTIRIILADTVEVLIAALCVSYSFDGVPRLNSVKALAKYAFFAVFLAPFAGAFVGALAISGGYWSSWKTCFFSEALAFLTLMPAILSWVSEARAWSQKSRADYLEATVLITAFLLFGYITFVVSGKNTPPALFYFLVPFLLWSALRFGSIGVSTSVIVIAFVSLWGAVHGSGPFAESGPLENVLSLQLFLFFAAAPFMVLAALVEEDKQAEQSLRESEKRLKQTNEELRKDIIERQRAEEALQESQAGLARVTRVLAMGELVASIAHEVNQPLTAVVINGNFCTRQLAGKIPNLNKLRAAIAEIVNDGTRASAVISRIRTLLVKGAPSRDEPDINEVIQEVVILMRNEVSRNRVFLRFDLAADLPRVLGDRVQLQQVLINLLMNGIDAMLTVTDQPRELLIKSARNHSEVLIQIQDSGEGLDPQQREHIFEPFFTTKPEGIGMGLSISRSIVESHEGRLWAELGSRGALFQFTLPAQ
jgi:signal transduction histidine kinase